MTTLGAFVAGLVAGAALGVLAGAALGSLDFLAGQVWGKLLVTPPSPPLCPPRGRRG